MNQELNPKGNGWALLPFLLFIVIYLGAGLILQAQGVKMAFYQFPSVTAMFLAVIAAFCMGGKRWMKNLPCLPAALPTKTC